MVRVYMLLLLRAFRYIKNSFSVQDFGTGQMMILYCF